MHINNVLEFGKMQKYVAEIGNTLLERIRQCAFLSTDTGNFLENHLNSRNNVLPVQKISKTNYHFFTRFD